MREILFKAKSTPKKSGEFDNVWVYGDLIHSGGKYYIHPKGNLVSVIGELGKIIVMHEVIPETICQYTGLTDKNGNKIWENDILSVLLIGETDEQKENCIVRYGRKTENFRIELGFNLEWTKTDYLRCDICFWTENREVEVIGNIFDNPELIGE